MSGHEVLGRFDSLVEARDFMENEELAEGLNGFIITPDGNLEW